ncbi:hypothetical protein BCR32DRAFT_278764 [Anaeromyces robustus]|uniref:Ankyrin n=1 Tax=Anaeromyces robustus TaxID=1754192 RepID=A0A1Y1XA43_9FUNG|nr:hypothetical protein BCR32DRAFT_278764 [Anaeromyces robustus]|eukprot:ORX82615.1 hypothetical protein BCR32DRAFT_278764 [Anaeromyces robustus]
MSVDSFLTIIESENYNKAKRIINDAFRKNAFWDLNDRNDCGYYPLIRLVKANNIEMVNLIIDYANKNNIILEWKAIMDYTMEKEIFSLYLNDKDINKNCLLLEAISQNNVRMVQLLIDYADKNNIILEVKARDIDGVNSLLMAIEKNNIDMVQLIMDYSIKHKIIFDINEKNKTNVVLEFNDIDGIDIPFWIGVNNG